ncbi:hypothetical protein BGX27_007730 [Mortierella sp. AM989]|nr:hypothetical protein BGX27_007730 [Mortierella sp. AM989]
MRAHIVGKSGRDLRQNYIQQYLKQFLQRVHPDLFQNHPKEQLRNSTSLQDLLPLVNHEKHIHSDKRPSPSGNSAENDRTKLIFYFKPKNLGTPSSISANSSKAVNQSQSQLESVEHSLPAFVPTNRSIKADDNTKQDALEQELKSWQTVQSFLELCRKVGVSVKESDQKDVALQLEMSVQEITTKEKMASHIPQKPLSEIFQEELQSSFSGSTGYRKPAQAWKETNIGSTAAGEDVSHSYLGKIGGMAPALDAQVMIESNPLLFKSPELSSSRLSKVVRTWIHWQDEDQQQASSPSASQPSATFCLGNWWRKVPIMILNSKEEREGILRSSENTKKAILVVDQEMSKQEMTEYLTNNLKRVQAEYKDMLRLTLASTSNSPPSWASTHNQRQQEQDTQQGHQPQWSATPDAESYLERMRMKTRFQNARGQFTRGSGGGYSTNKRR